MIDWMKKNALAFWRTVCLPIWAWGWRLWNRLRRRKPWADPSADPIKYVFVLMLENRSFDQVLGCFKDGDRYAQLEGVDPNALHSNADRDGIPYYQAAADHDRSPFDPNHEHEGIVEQLEDNHGGFVRNYQRTHPTAGPDDFQTVMDYFPKDALPAMHWLGETFTICDHWFSSVPGPTWANRLFLLSGTSMGRTEMGSTANPGGLFGYNQTTIFNLLEDAGVPWRVYFHDFPQSLLLDRQRQPEMIGNYCPMGSEEDGGGFESDLRREGENFPRFCFIEPQYFEPEQNDDHPTSSKMAAQQLIARVYNAIRANDVVWKSSLLIVLYDEHGGFFDHVPPPTAVAPVVPAGYAYHDHGRRCDFRSLGVRVPAVLVSPWMGQTVHSEHFDHTSLLKYVCQKWKLPNLTARVDAARDFGSAILSSAREITAEPITIPERERMYGAQPMEEAEESDHQRALRELCAKIEREEIGPVAAATAPRERLMAGAMPGNESQEMRARTLNITDAIKAKAARRPPEPGDAQP